MSAKNELVELMKAKGLNQTQVARAADAVAQRAEARWAALIGAFRTRRA